jgi:predicted DNA-binding protein (MmcQ/YjbR family)
MTKQKLLQLIRESRELVKTANPEQKIRLLKLIKESYQRLRESQQTILLNEHEDDQSGDYLEEK